MIICVRRQNVESGLKLQTDDLTYAIDYIKTYMTAYLAGNELSADFYAYALPSSHSCSFLAGLRR